MAETSTRPQYPAGVERRDRSVRNRVRRRLWNVGVGWWGLLSVLAIHQAFVAVTLAVDTWVTNDAIVDVFWPEAQPFVFAAAVAGTLDTHRRWTRGRASAAHALMLGGYLSRALVLVVGTIRYGEWSSSIVLGVLTWVALGAVAHLGWTKVRREALCEETIP